ncbi:hypothetical protein jhhlp_003633 [Lomentospora prolificans]|uniref:DUF7053 domain-containing protein n=1 Tax=Lomentospora prolificans TaxID=41688 RepID=A0A2N3N9B4_9PEZI|nr:hypothetical protein jhhlp_003633 [Lomentospora prolificans]
MSKRTVFTTITPLPPSITREVAVSFLQDHLRMIDLNPLVIARHPIACPANAPPDERHCAWYSLTDSISYLPGGKVTGEVSYTAAFNNVPKGVQTHVYAPMGLNIRETWTVGGTLPGEPKEPVELGIGAPQSGLYVREDVDMRCNVFMAAFVKKTLKKAHSSLVEAIKIGAQTASAGSVPASRPNAAQQNSRPSGYPLPAPAAPAAAAAASSSYSGNPPSYDSVSPTNPVFSFTASPTTSRRLSMDDKDNGLLIDHTLYTLSPLQTHISRLGSFRSTGSTSTLATALGADAATTIYKFERDSDSPILSRLTTNLPPYLPASSFTSSPTPNNDESPTSGHQSAYPSPLRVGRRPTSASFYPSTPHEEATRPSPPACFTAWQPLKPSVSVVSKYPRAKEQDYSDIAAANPFTFDESPTSESLTLEEDKSQKSQRINVKMDEIPQIPQIPTTLVTRKEDNGPPLVRYPAIEPESMPTLDLGALGILPAGRPRSALEVRPTRRKKTPSYSAYVPPTTPAVPAPPPELQTQQTQYRSRFEGVGATLSGPPITDWYY